MNRYGVDKPDTRFAMELVDFSDTFKSSGFKVFASTVAAGGSVKAFNVSSGSVEPPPLPLGLSGGVGCAPLMSR